MSKLTYILVMVIIVLALAVVALNRQLELSTSQLGDSQTQITNLHIEINSLSQNTFWTDGHDQIVPKEGYLFGSLPDSFSVLLQYTANTSISTIILNNTQYARFQNNENYTPYAIYNGSKQDVWINVSDGCSGYVFIQKASNFSAFKYYPNIYAKYAPTETFTGDCQQ
ncbi:MAG: hypothetical protein ABSE71_04020 [Candidatus Micrarchaeaceae archaeon]|jgi:flagellar basal body-associated protein FliL|nr:hypothetical protein [Candidatus Micrarchaeota archaeon]HII10334.1 hypothetical protein [Candidatus Micrarchaeota archaeon]